ncbi:MAG: hypothetical protein V4547_18845 [Bacteroidota bacterium]
MTKAKGSDLSSKILPKQHTEFIRLVANGEKQKYAYSLSYPNKSLSSKTCEVESSKLAKKYAVLITQEQERLQKVITDAKDAEVVKAAINGILSQAEVDKKLCDIINGDLIRITAVDAFGKTHTNEITSTLSQRLLAIDLYNKRFGSNAPIKNKTEITGQLKYEAPTAEQLKASKEKLDNAI